MAVVGGIRIGQVGGVAKANGADPGRAGKVAAHGEKVHRPRLVHAIVVTGAQGRSNRQNAAIGAHRYGGTKVIKVT